MVNPPDQPPPFRQPAFRQPTPSERPWWWRFESSAGVEVAVSENLADERFTSQADAESWVGETWSDLASEGVDAVTLFENDRQVYGPMSLHS